LSLLASANGWWEWFLKAILEGGPTELIAAKNRSPEMFKNFSRFPRVFSFF
jgi:hypothetical protein